jgi:hypothetical protein
MKRITVKNNWEHYQYYIDGELIENPIKSIKHIAIRWPNDKVIKYHNVKWFRENKSYNDMGHTYDTFRDIMAIPIEVNGLEMGYSLRLCDDPTANKLEIYLLED